MKVFYNFYECQQLKVIFFFNTNFYFMEQSFGKSLISLISKNSFAVIVKYTISHF